MKRLISVICMTAVGMWMNGVALGADEGKAKDEPMKPKWNQGQGGEKGRFGARGGGEGENRGAAGGEGRFARWGGGEGGMGGELQEAMIARILANTKVAQEVGLTEDQIATLRNKLDELRKEEADIRAALEKLGIDQAKLLTEKDLNEEAIMAAVDKLAEKRTALAKLQIKKLILIKKTITPEQMQKIQEILRRHRENMAAGGEGKEAGQGMGERKEWKERRAEMREQRKEMKEAEKKDAPAAGGEMKLVQ